MITFKHTGNFKITTDFLSNAMKNPMFDILMRKYGDIGVTALSRNTPVDTGVASNSWSYRVQKTRSGFSLTWSNDDVTAPGGVPIVILLQYGHATTGGTFVQGYDFLNPTMKPIFDQLSQNLWEEVTK
jgi:hypothetical protein